jgi:hypothetical protein
MDDGSEENLAKDTGVIPPRHNPWVIGNEPVVVAINFIGLKDYAKRS